MESCSVNLNRKQHSPTYLMVYSKIDGRHRTDELFLSLIQPIKVGKQVTKSHLRNHLKKLISRFSKNLIQKSPHYVFRLIPTAPMNPRSKFIKSFRVFFVKKIENRKHLTLSHLIWILKSNIVDERFNYLASRDLIVIGYENELLLGPRNGDIDHSRIINEP